MAELIFALFLPHLFAFFVFLPGMLRVRDWIALNSTEEFKGGELSLGDYVLLRGRATCSDLSSLTVPFTGEKGIYYYCKMNEYKRGPESIGEAILTSSSHHNRHGRVDTKALTDRVTFIQMFLDEGGEIDVKTSDAIFLARNKKQHREADVSSMIFSNFYSAFSGYVKSIDIDEGVTVVGTVTEFNNKGFVGGGSLVQPTIITNYSPTEIDNHRNVGIVFMIIAGIISGISIFYTMSWGLFQ